MYGSRGIEVQRHGRRGASLDTHVEQAAELRAVLDRALVVPSLRPDALKCALGLCALYDRRGPQVAVVRVVGEALALDTPHDEDWQHRTRLLRSHWSKALGRLGRVAEARVELEALLEETLDPDFRASATAELADLFAREGDPRSHATYELALSLARAHGPRAVVATCLGGVAVGLYSRGERERARALTAEALQICPPDNLRAEFEVRKTDAWLKLELDDFEGAEAAYRALLVLAEKLGEVRGTTYVTGQLAFVAEGRGQLPEAERLYHAAALGFAGHGDPAFHGYYLGYRARVLIGLGRVDEGVQTLEAVLGASLSMDPSLEQSLWLVLAVGYGCQGRVEDTLRIAHRHTRHGTSVPEALARGLAAVAARDRGGARGHLVRAEAACAEFEDLLLRQLATSGVAVLAAEVRAWQIHADGSFVETPDGEQIEVGRHLSNARILAHLVRQRADAPGDTTDAEGLARVGWPGERIVPAAAANRVRVALSALRRAGLTALIERTDGGWRLDPTVEIRIRAT